MNLKRTTTKGRFLKKSFEVCSLIPHIRKKKGCVGVPR